MIVRIYTEYTPNLASIVLTYFDDFTMSKAQGYYGGEVEDAAIIEIVGDITPAAIATLCQDIIKTNEQECVLVSYIPSHDGTIERITEKPSNQLALPVIGATDGKP